MAAWNACSGAGGMTIVNGIPNVSWTCTAFICISDRARLMIVRFNNFALPKTIISRSLIGNTSALDGCWLPFRDQENLIAHSKPGQIPHGGCANTQKCMRVRHDKCCPTPVPAGGGRLWFRHQTVLLMQKEGRIPYCVRTE